MQHPSPSLLLGLAVVSSLATILLGLAVVSSLATTDFTTSATTAFTTSVSCFGDGEYTANSTYEANLRRLASILPAETSSQPRYGYYRDIGYWPNRVRAASTCFTRNSSGCAACVAGAFKEAERACPYGKEVMVFAGDCSLRLGNFTAFSFRSNQVFGSSIIKYLAPVMILQAIGLGFLCFLFLQEWRNKRRGSVMRDSSLPSEDQ